MLLNGPGELHARRQLHPRRGARAPALFRLRRLQLGRHRQRRRRRPADRRMDRRRRSAARPVGRRHPPLRAVPRQPPAPRRPHGRDARPALRDALAARGAGDRASAAPLAALRPARAKGAVFGSKLNWERANYFLPRGCAEPRRHARHAGMAAAACSTSSAPRREDVVVFDQTSFAKFVLKGRDALAVLQRLCANDIDVAPGRMVYTAMLNERGGFESDLTITRLARRHVFHPHRLGAGDARCRLDRPRTSATTSSPRWSTSPARTRCCR